MAKTIEGNCYICGTKLGKIAMKNHLLKVHNEKTDIQDCYLLKIEGIYSKNYWLYIDVPINRTLSDIDTFLREIWLECWGHLSAFYYSKCDEIRINRKLNTFSDGDKIQHEYDFGTTTDTLITFIGKIKRPRQKEIVRLLARNIPPQFQCVECGKLADYICPECIYDIENPFYCDACADKHGHEEMLLPITNSPRMGECGYEGEFDIYTFDAGHISK